MLSCFCLGSSKNVVNKNSILKLWVTDLLFGKCKNRVNINMYSFADILIILFIIQLVVIDKII